MPFFRINAFISSITFLIISISGAYAQCSGRNLIEVLKAEHPEKYKALVERSEKVPYHEGKLFSVTKEGYAPSYVFGTMHSGDPSITQFSPQLLKAFDSSLSIAFELKEVGGLADPALAEKMGSSFLTYIMAKDEEKISKLFSEEERKEIEIVAEKYGLPVLALDYFKPSFIGVAISTPVCEAKQKRSGVDSLLAQRATNMGKTFIGLETVEEQLKVMADYSPETQRAILYNAVKQQTILEDMFETMVQLYKQGHIALLVEFSELDEFGPKIENKEAMDGVMKNLVDVRNERLFTRSLPLVQNGGAFIAIGAAHLPGEAGLLKLYEKAGYIVTKIE